MKHEDGRQAPIVEENPGLRTSGNEGQASSGQNSTFFGELRKKATVPLAVAGVATGLLGAKMFAPAERSTDQEALNSLKNRPASELVLGSVEAAKAEGVIGEPAFKSASFPDVSDSNPYYEAITGMADAGIIGGFDDGTFGPDKLVTRQQFAKMIVGAMSPTVVATEDSWQDSNKPFNDLVPDDPNSLYPNDYVAEAFKNGITQGKSPGKYAPYDNITRAHVTTMAVRAAQNLEPGVLQDPPANYTGTLGDFDPNHGKNLIKAEYNGLTEGLREFYAGWNPWQEATRGEVAQMLWNLKTFEKQEKQGADLVDVQKMAPYDADVPLALRDAVLGGVSGAKIITSIQAEHPANASIKASFYLVDTDDPNLRLFILKEGDDYVVRPYRPTFFIFYNQFHTNLVFLYDVKPDMSNAFMSFELGNQFARINGESADDYLTRAVQLTDNIERDHGSNGWVKPEEVKDILGSSTALKVSSSQGMVTYNRDSDQAAIAKLANSF